MSGNTAEKPKHRWAFTARFRARAFGWRSQPAITRVKEAVAEIKKAARADPVLGAEGAVLFIERISPALEQVDSSSGAMGTAVSNALRDLVPIILQASATEPARDHWLERLWTAFQDDEMPYIESIADQWGPLCMTRERASRWAGTLLPPLMLSWSQPRGAGRYFKGTSACLSCLLQAQRYDELLELLARAPFVFWHHHRFGALALAAMGQLDEAIAYAERSVGLNDSAQEMAGTCEAILLSAGRAEEAYQRYALLANQRSTGLATFQTLAKKYPSRDKATVLADLVASTPGEEGRWFATAKAIGFFDQALELARRSRCDPKTLNRAARDHQEKDPRFALGASLLALKWLAEGYGYEVSTLDAYEALGYVLKTGATLGLQAETRARILAITAPGAHCDPAIRAIVARVLG
jgi:tetratricopeptide (TPR) repeat protein